MLNIISRSVIETKPSGPKKVVDNLIKGLDELGYPYVVNKSLDSTKRLWIHDDREALKELPKLPKEVKAIVGPNLYILPRNIPSDVDFRDAVYIHPSIWPKKLWEKENFDRAPLDFWPTGIDTNEYQPFNEKKEYVLIYFKQRFEDELKKVEEELVKKSLNFRVIIYGQYEEKEYKDLLVRSKYIIWLGRQESQGIALEEALASTVPILVWDVENLGHWKASPKEMAIFNEEENAFSEATAIPYFDERCGIVIKSGDELPEALKRMEESYGQFKPRDYVLENLSLKKQAEALLRLYEKHFHLDYESGFNEKAIAPLRNWRNGKLYYKIYLRLREKMKGIF